MKNRQTSVMCVIRHENIISTHVLLHTPQKHGQSPQGMLRRILINTALTLYKFSL